MNIWLKYFKKKKKSATPMSVLIQALPAMKFGSSLPVQSTCYVALVICNIHAVIQHYIAWDTGSCGNSKEYRERKWSLMNTKIFHIGLLHWKLNITTFKQ